MKRLFVLLISVFIFSGCEYFENLEFTPVAPDDNQYHSIKGDINGFDEFVYNNNSFIFYKERDSGLPEAMFVYVYDGESEVVEAIYFNQQGIPEYYNINGKSVYVENVRGELCDLVVASDDGSFTTLKDIDTDLDIENFWASQQSTRSSSGSAVVGAVNLSNRILGARYLMQGGVDMGFGAYGMIVGCAMLVPGCNVAVGATLVIGGLTGFTSGAMKVVRATDLLVSDGTHTDGAYQGTVEVLDVVSTTCNAIGGASAIGRELANIAINQGVDFVLDNWDKRAREIEMMEKKQRIEAITLTTGESEIDYMNCNVTLKGSLSSTLSSNDYVGIYISEEPATESVLDCDANYAHNGYFSFTFENLERCKTYYYRTYYNSEEFDRTFVGECKEFIIPGVETGEYTKVSDKTYKVSVDAVFGDIVDFAEVGVCYSNENREPTIGDNSSETNPIFSSQNLNFNISTKELPCYYRAYMIIDDRYVIYGDVMCIKDDSNHPHAVDLGLSVKWACCNVGANSPEEYGDYFAWGETSPKSSYTPFNYQHWVDYDGDGWGDGGEFTINSDISGTQYDAATVNWGGGWRMPTEAEQKELYDNCAWTWTSMNGVNGMEVTGSNGNSIFLPAAGCRGGSSSNGVGSYGGYWSSTPFEGDDDCAYTLNFYSEDLYWLWDYRYDGLSVRPVSE